MNQGQCCDSPSSDQGRCFITEVVFGSTAEKEHTSACGKKYAKLLGGYCNPSQIVNQTSQNIEDFRIVNQTTRKLVQHRFMISRTARQETQGKEPFHCIVWSDIIGRRGEPQPLHVDEAQHDDDSLEKKCQ